MISCTQIFFRLLKYVKTSGVLRNFKGAPLNILSTAILFTEKTGILNQVKYT